MKKYIDVTLAKAEFTGNFQNFYAPGEIKAILDEVPTADVVEIVRCKDCRKFKNGICYDENGLVVAGNYDFCSYGERGETK